MLIVVDKRSADVLTEADEGIYSVSRFCCFEGPGSHEQLADLWLLPNVNQGFHTGKMLNRETNHRFIHVGFRFRRLRQRNISRYRFYHKMESFEDSPNCEDNFAVDNMDPALNNTSPSSNNLSDNPNTEEVGSIQNFAHEFPLDIRNIW
jgi:hypothetical protein